MNQKNVISHQASKQCKVLGRLKVKKPGVLYNKEIGVSVVQ